MNVGQEKEHIYSIMRDITAERRRLTDMYFEMKKRLDSLYELEEKGLYDLDIKGYVDLRNELNREASLRNVARESENAINKINEDFDSRSSEEDEEKKSIIKKSINKERSLYKDSQDKPDVTSYESMKSLVRTILMENGSPMSLDELLEAMNKRIEDGAITKKNLSSNILYRIFKDNDEKIKRVSRGYYQYKL